MEPSRCGGLCLTLIISFIVGTTCVLVAGTCKTVELRQNNTALCMLIHSDQAAGTLLAVGWVFSLPWMFCALAFLFSCYLWISDWEDCRKKLLVSFATYWHYTKSCRVDLGQWFSELRWKWSKHCTKSSYKTFNATGKNWLRTLQVYWILTYSIKLTRKGNQFSCCQNTRTPLASQLV